MLPTSHSRYDLDTGHGAEAFMVTRVVVASIKILAGWINEERNETHARDEKYLKNELDLQLSPTHDRETKLCPTA